MSDRIPCPRCGKENELYLGTVTCSNCHLSYGKCKKCGEIFDATGGVSATCPDCRAEAAEADYDGTFIGKLDAKIMNSNHNLENWLLRLFVAIPLLKPLKLRRKGGAAWWFGTIWLSLYVGAILSIVATYGLKAGGPHADLCCGIMGWGSSFLLFLLPRVIQLCKASGSKKVLITTIVVVVLDIVAIILAYQFSVGNKKNNTIENNVVQNNTVKNIPVETSEMKDARDGQIYKTVKIGNQVWMAENLNYKAKDSHCYQNKSVNCKKYGRFYTWKAAQKACPAGWHVPGKNDFNTLIATIGGDNVAGKKLKSTHGWYENHNGTNDYGFNALPAGGYYGNEDGWGFLGGFASFWSSTGSEDYRSSAFYLSLYYLNDDAKVNSISKDLWLAIRCLKD